MPYSQLHPGLRGFIYALSAPEQLISIPGQLVSATKLRKCSGAAVD